MANEFGYCLDCCEMQYVTPDRNGVYSGNNGGKMNHFGHKVYVFEEPNKYTPPIRNLLTKLNANMEISDNEMILFRLAIDLGDLEPFIGKYERIIPEPEPREIVPDGYYPNVGLFAKKSPFADLPLFGETS